MPLRETIRLAFESLNTNRFRAALTMLGLVIGVSAVILLVSIGTGAKRYILSEFEGMGTNLIMVQPGKVDAKSNLGPPIGAAQRKLTISDVDAIEKRAFNIEAVSGVVLASASIRYNANLNNVNLLGANDRFTDILNITTSQGNWFTREEDDFGRRVAVLGAKIADNLFGNEYAIGRSVRINQSDFKVIGVLDSVGDKVGFNLDNFAFVPTRAALRLFNDDKLFGLRAKASSRSGVNDAVEEMRTILKERRQGEEDFTIITQDAMMESMSTILSMLTYVLAAIASISMLVGGVGIMNIMLVSVAERTPEIGVRRAVGAQKRDILKQFVVEAVTLSCTGGITGLVLSVGLTQLGFLFFPAFDLRTPFWIVPPALLISVSIGVIFGVWPAWKASQIEILNALRYE